MSEPIKSCAFTGHRPQKFPWRYDETDRRCVALKAKLTEQITALIDRGITTFLCGMALGTDVWCAQIVLALQKINPTVELHCILPCEDQEIKWTASEQEQYHTILKQANKVVYVGRKYTSDCMLKRNRYMVEHSSILLAVFNGVQRSGTGATLRYAQQVGREVIIIKPS